MNRNMRSIQQTLLATIICLTFGCGTGGEPTGQGTIETQSALVNREDILLKVNGICDENRSYGLLESNLIDRPDGFSEIRQIIFRENGTYVATSEKFKITKRGKNLISFSDRTEAIKNGNWSISPAGVKLEDGLLNYRDDNESFTLSSSQNKNEAIIFRRIEKISEQFIPQEFGCMNQSEILAKTTSGKFSVDRDGLYESSGLMRRTLKDTDLMVLFGDVHSMTSGTPVYCNRFGFSSYCEISIQLNRSMTGLLELKDDSSNRTALPVTVKYNDNHFELISNSGKIIRLIPSPEYSGFFIEDTEEFLSE